MPYADARTASFENDTITPFVLYTWKANKKQINVERLEIVHFMMTPYKSQVKAKRIRAPRLNDAIGALFFLLTI